MESGNYQVLIEVTMIGFYHSALQLGDEALNDSIAGLDYINRPKIN